MPNLENTVPPLLIAVLFAAKERALAAQFGVEFQHYKQKVSRWV
jgi:protein-S-isoprenylcysteine O-methyltransferase Ste14